MGGGHGKDKLRIKVCQHLDYYASLTGVKIGHKIVQQQDSGAILGCQASNLSNFKQKRDELLLPPRGKFTRSAIFEYNGKIVLMSTKKITPKSLFILD